MIIAVDFDGTIVEHEYPKIGSEIPFAIQNLKKLQQEHHHRLILWTIRTGKELEEAIDFCKERGLEFYCHNENYPGEEFTPEMPRKLTCDLFIDDRNVGGLDDWGIIYHKIIGAKSSDPLYHSSDKKTKKKNILIRLGEWIERLK
jgi:hypothetical protein